MTSENAGFWSRYGIPEDLQLPHGLGLGTVVCQRAVSILAALSGVMLSPSSVSGSSQDGMTAYKSSAVGWTHRAWNSSRASMISGPSRHRLLAVKVGAREDDLKTRLRGL